MTRTSVTVSQPCIFSSFSPRFQITRRPATITRQRKPNGACVWHPLPMTKKYGKIFSPIFSGNPLRSRRTLAFAELKDMTKCRTFWPPLSSRNMQVNSTIAYFSGVCNQIISNINYSIGISPSQRQMYIFFSAWWVRVCFLFTNFNCKSFKVFMKDERSWITALHFTWDPGLYSVRDIFEVLSGFQFLGSP